MPPLRGFTSRARVALVAVCGIVLVTSALGEERKPPPKPPPPSKPSFQPTLLQGMPVKIAGQVTANYQVQRQGPSASRGPALGGSGQRR